MLRLSLAALLVCVACGKDVDDPSFDNTASGGGGSSSGGSSSGGSEGTVSASSNPTTGDSADSNADDAADSGGATSGPAGTTGAGSDGANGTCGDGAISPGEQCDGDDLQNFDCMSLGLSGGTLSCDPMTCTFDTSMCMSMGSTSGW